MFGKSVLSSNREDDVLTGLKRLFDRPPDRLNLVFTGRPVTNWLKGNTGYVDTSWWRRQCVYHEGTGSSVFEDPRQLAIDTISGNIFVADYATNKI